MKNGYKCLNSDIWHLSFTFGEEKKGKENNIQEHVRESEDPTLFNIFFSVLHFHSSPLVLYSLSLLYTPPTHKDSAGYITSSLSPVINYSELTLA